MSALVIALLLGPALGAAAVALVPERAPSIGLPVAGLVALGWAVVATREVPFDVGELAIDPLISVAAAGVALLALTARSITATGAAAALLALTVLPGTAALDPGRLPDRRFAAGIVLIGILAAARLLAERGPRLGQVVVVVAAAVMATGLVGDDPREAVVLAAAGTLVAVVASAVWGAPGRLLLPAGLLALARAGALRPGADDLDVALLVVAGLVLLGAGVLALARARPVTDRLPLAGVLAAAGLLSFEVPELRAAGALLGAGAVLAVASRHPAALLALVPGLAAAVHVAGLGAEPEHAAVGAAVLVVLGAGAFGRLGGHDPLVPRAVPVLAAAFAVVPLWDWSGADTDDHGRAVLLLLAVALPVLVLHALDATTGWRGHLADVAGRIVARPRADPSHGTAHPAESSAEAAHPEEAGAPSP